MTKRAEESLAQALDAVASYLVQGGRAVALTGAGVSVDSGIPDFRSEGGLWSRFHPMEYATIEAFRANPRKVWDMVFELEATLDGAQPNDAHRALAEMEELGLLEAVITQNIDGLHQRAGSRDVIEFHGSAARLACINCAVVVDAPSRVRASREPPVCGCGAILKPDIVFFGEPIPTTAITRAVRLASECRVMFVVGTSAVVSPASELPVMALRGGAMLVEANREQTALSSLCMHRLLGNAGATLRSLVEIVKTKMRDRG